MKAAIIGSLHTLDLAAGEYNLILPDFWSIGGYSAWAKGVNGYRIVDNGAAESGAVSNFRIMQLAHILGAHEVVIPDELNNARATIAKLRDFADEYFMPLYNQYKFAGVLQGRTDDEVIQCAEEFRKVDAYVRVLMLPRCLNTADQPLRRLALADFFTGHPDYQKYEFHALGCSASYHEEVPELAKLRVRSIDTSLPVVLGMAGMDLETGEYLPRGATQQFFNRPPTASQRFLIERNIKAFRKLAGDV